MTVKNRNTYYPGEQLELCEMPSITKQAFKDECDINAIVKRHQATGMVTHVNRNRPAYGDFSYGLDLQQAMEAVRAAQDDFMRLPARVRALASNDPARFLAMVHDDDGLEMLIEAGLPESEARIVRVEDNTNGTISPEGTTAPSGDGVSQPSSHQVVGTGQGEPRE